MENGVHDNNRLKLNSLEDKVADIMERFLDVFAQTLVAKPGNYQNNIYYWSMWKKNKLANLKT